LTQPQAASPAQVSEASAGSPRHTANGYPEPLGPLICDPADIFDATTVRAQIEATAADTSPAELRGETVKILRAANKAGRAVIAEAFAAKPFAARELTRSYTFLTDGLGLFFGLLVSGVGTLIMLYARGYFGRAGPTSADDL
jgi:[protein-PII] uridylyltransferase